MQIGIIGAGTVGTKLGERFAAAGHEVLIANSRGPESLVRELAELPQSLKAMALMDLVDRAEVILLAVPWVSVHDVLRDDIDWAGRILVDATNIILSVDPEVEVADLKGESGSQLVARLAPSARVVKAFNTLPFDILSSPPVEGFRRVLFVAGDAQNAVSTVSDLIAEIGLHPVAAGPLATAGRQMEIGGVFSRLELFAADEVP